MRWTPGRRSEQLEDRRAQRASGGGLTRSAGGSIAILSFLFRRFGIPGVLVGGAALYFLGGLTGGEAGSGLSGAGQQTRGAGAGTEQEEKLVQFVSFILDDAQSLWVQQFKGHPGEYRLANLVLFRDATKSGCGLGKAAMGPFYCPADEKVYLDLSFFEDLSRRLGAPGDFAQAYVIGHEIGHHVQNILGATSRVHRAPKSEQTGERGLSVRLELQADCYAGVWANSARRRQILDPGDLEEALNAAQKIGDDALQESATGRIRPETFTHGSSKQRARWFREGFDHGEMSRCDTFGTQRL